VRELAFESDRFDAQIEAMTACTTSAGPQVRRSTCYA
jgi:hypothetical protein